MPNFLIYARPYENQNDKTIYPQLKVNAANQFKFYTPYPYFASHLYEKPFPRFKGGSRESTANEHLARARRVVLFTDITKLKPMNFSKHYYGKLGDRVYKVGDCDHLSNWKSSRGTKFILNESYHAHPDYMLKLAAEGLIAIELPTAISPYCGRWDPTPGAKPWTTSFLICDADGADELDNLIWTINIRMEDDKFHGGSIEVNLIPAWNSLEGVSYVK